jgi:hypothetical protein
MSQTVKQGAVSKLCIKNRAPGTISTGANTEVTLDGQRVPGISFLKLEFKPKNIVKVTMEMYCEVEVEADVQLEQTATNLYEEYKIGEAIYVLSKYETIGIPKVIKKAQDGQED